MNIVKIRNEMRNGRTIFDLPLRVTFYARVSTDRDEQLNSLENQVQYYTELIQSKRSWSYVPGYIDEGISGTSTKKRDSFLRMIQDAKDGRFDLSSRRRYPVSHVLHWTASSTRRSFWSMTSVSCSRTTTSIRLTRTANSGWSSWQV